MIVLAGDAQAQLRLLHRWPEQTGKPVLQLLLQRLCLVGPNVIGPRVSRQEEQQAERS